MTFVTAYKCKKMLFTFDCIYFCIELIYNTGASLIALSVKKSACQARDLSSISGSERSPGEGNGNPLQCSFLENPMDRGAWRATVHRVTKSQTQLRD